MTDREPGRARDLEVRFHGRGGQGVVTAAELLSIAAFDEGLSAQAIPSFGSERTGAPVVAYCRIREHPIRSHDPVTEPDLLVVSDPTMLHVPGLLDGLRPTGRCLVNSTRSPAGLGLAGSPTRTVTVPASELARARLGRPLPNTALLGALAALTAIVSLPALQDAIRERFSGQAGQRNADLAEDGYRLCAETREEVERRASTA